MLKSLLIKVTTYLIKTLIRQNSNMWHSTAIVTWRPTKWWEMTLNVRTSRKKTLNKFKTQMKNIRLALNSPMLSSENLMVHKDIIILLANRTLGTMPNEFAKQKGLRWDFLSQNETSFVRLAKKLSQVTITTSIAVIAVESAIKYSFVQRCIQMRQKGQ